MNLTAFTWKLEKVNKDRIRLVVWTAPGYAGQLARQLAGWNARKKNLSSVVLRVPRCMHDLVRRMGAPEEFVRLLEEYADCWKVGRRGVQVGAEVKQRRRDLVQRLMEGPPGSIS